MRGWFLISLLLLTVSASAAEPLQLMSTAKLAALQASLPEVASPELASLLTNPRTLWYTNDEIPPGYQFAETGSITGGQIGRNPEAYFLDVRWNISGDAREAAKGHGRGGNGNVEFPWRTPGGLDQAEGMFTTYRFMSLPANWPVVVFTKPVFMPTITSEGRITGGLTQYMTGWTFPTGTTFGEVLFQRSPAGDFVVFEIRIRTKRENAWDVDIFRPFPLATDLARALAARGLPELGQQVLASVPEVKTLVDRSHPTEAGFATSAAVDTLPPMPPELVDSLLQKTVFKSALGWAWKSVGEAHVFAPTTTNYSIVPPGYAATFLGSDSLSCMNCHKHTLTHVNTFHLGRDWYGTIRGSDGIFTFHPITPEAVSLRSQRRAPTLRQSFLDAGLVARYDPAKHPSSVYLQTKVPE